MKKRLLLYVAFIITAIVMNAQTNCNVFITGSFDSKCVLNDEKNNILIEKGEAMLACKESQVIYTTNITDGLSYTWTIIGAYNYSASGNTVTVNWSNGNTGKVTVAVNTLNGACGNSKDIILIEKPQIGSSSLPSYKLINGSKVIQVCVGDNVSFINESTTSNTDITGHYWKSDYGVASTENYTIENVTQGTSVIHRIYNNCGCEDEEEYKIEILEGENLKLSCYGTVCENSEVTYEALNANCTDYNWSVQGGQIIKGQHSPKITIQWGSPQCGYGTLGLDGGLCENSCPKLMSVKIPIITNNAEITGQITACEGEIVVYSLPLWGSTEYTWTITPSQGITQYHYNNANQTLITFNSPGTYQLSATYKCDFLECGPFTSQTKTITVKPELKISSENKKICLGQAATFTLNNTTISARWRVYNASNQEVYTTLTNSLVYTPTAVGTYKVTAEYADYCNVAEFLFDVKNAPPAPTGATLSGKHFVCPNSSLLLTGTPESPFYSLVWKSLCSTPPIEGTGNEFTVAYPGNGCNVEVYNYDKEIGCLSTPYIYQIQDFNLASTTLPITTINTPIKACEGSMIEYINNEVPDQSPDVLYEWKISPEYAATIVGDKTKNNVSIMVNISSLTTTFSIILERKYCTNIITTTTIYVEKVSIPLPPTISPSPIPDACLYSNVTLTGTGSSIQSGFSWYVDNASANNNTNTFNHAFTTTGTHYIELSYQPYAACPAVKTNTTINIINPPEFELIKGPSNIYVSPSLTNPYDICYWTIGGVPVEQYNSTNPLNPYGLRAIPLTGIGTQEVCCTVTNNSGCSKTECITPSSSTTGPGNTDPCDLLNISMTSSICTDQSINVSAPLPTHWVVNPSITYATVTPPTISNNATIKFLIPGDYTVVGYATNGTNCYYGQVDVTVPCILNFDLEYNCSNQEIVITDNSEYLGSRPSRTFNITGGIVPVNMLSNETVKTRNVALPTSGTVTYNVTLTINGCTLTKSITLYPKITSASITAPFSNNACQDVPLLLTANTFPSSTPIKTYDWNFDDGSSNNSSTTNTIYHIFQVRPTDYKVGVNIIDVNNCTYTMPIASKLPITSNANNLSPNRLSLSPSFSKVCPGTAIPIYYNTGAPTNTYLWQLTPPTNNSYSYNTYQTGDYYVSVTSNIGCIGEAMINVPFKNKPTAFISKKRQCCLDDEVELFGDAGSNNVSYVWDITTPNAILLQETTPNITFPASQIGTYNVNLTVSNGDCSDTYNHTFTIYAPPVAPQIYFTGNNCIDQPPVELGALAPNGELIYWSSGVSGQNADYYTSGSALAYYYKNNTGCKSQYADIYIEPAPNFDALLTGCYKRCKSLLPASINVYNLSKNDISWKWLLDQNLLTNGMGNYLLSPLTLPLAGLGTYNLDVNYNGGLCNVKSPSLVIEEGDCPCKDIDISYVTLSQHIEECKLFYDVEVIICNNGSQNACFDKIIPPEEGINILGTENFPLTISPGGCESFKFHFEVIDPLMTSAKFKLHDGCNDCDKEFSVDINVEVVPCGNDIQIQNLTFRSDLSNPNVSYFDFELFLPSNPQAVFKVWTEPSEVINHFYNPSTSIISGEAMFDNGILTQIAENKKVCFHVIMCQGDHFCESKVCIGAEELLGMIQGAKSTPSKENKKQEKGETLYLVPNPASTYVKIEGIEQDNISELLLIDMTGKNLKKVQGTNTLDIQDVSKGTYIIRVINKGNKVYYLKLIKN